jgi:hypothetical protein
MELVLSISARILPTSAVSRLFLLIFRLVNALMAKRISGVGQGIYIYIYICTYWHFGWKAATMLASWGLSLPLKSASVIVVVMVTACLSPNMIVANALMAGMDGAQHDGRCRYQ